MTGFSYLGTNCQKIRANPPSRSSHSHGGVGDPPVPFVLRALFVGGRRGASCCGGRFSMPSHSAPSRWFTRRCATRHGGALAIRRPPQWNCTADQSKVQGVAPQTGNNLVTTCPDCVHGISSKRKILATSQEKYGDQWGASSPPVASSHFSQSIAAAQ